MNIRTGARAQFILSEAGIEDLAVAGISTGWLSAWIRSAGAVQVQMHLLGEGTWKQAADWRVFFARDSELMRVGLYHGRRILAHEDGGRGLLGVGTFALDNPARKGWHYICEDGSRAVLLSLGDIAYQRERWLRLLNGSGGMQALHVYASDAGEIPLEPGLSGSLRRVPETGQTLLNDGGYLPEEILMHMLEARGLKVRFAESCTAGGLSERLSKIPGATRVLDCAWTSYSIESKHRLLKVPMRLISRCGAVSREVVEAMALAGADRVYACVAVSGIAGPSGDGGDKPVGSVWIAVALRDGTPDALHFTFTGSRAEIRRKTINQAFVMLVHML